MVTYTGANNALPIDLPLAAQMAWTWLEEWMHTPLKDMPHETVERGFMGYVMLAVLMDRSALRKDTRDFMGRIAVLVMDEPTTAKSWKQLNTTLTQSDALDK